MQLTLMSPPSRPRGFTLVELLVVIAILAVLSALVFAMAQRGRNAAKRAGAISQMKQCAIGVQSYTQDHNGRIPRGDDSADGSGGGGRGLIWINHIAPYLGYDELEDQMLNEGANGQDQWDYLLTRYRSAPFVCPGLNSEELAKTKASTIDAIGGIGYNVRMWVNGQSRNNASWGGVSEPIRFATITHISSRCMLASGYDWHLVGRNGDRAYDRFGKNSAAMVFWDGSGRVVDREEYDRAIDQENPTIPGG